VEHFRSGEHRLIREHATHVEQTDGIAANVVVLGPEYALRCLGVGNADLPNRSHNSTKMANLYRSRWRGVARDFDYLGHPQLFDYARAVMADPRTPEGLRTDPVLLAEFPPKELVMNTAAGVRYDIGRANCPECLRVYREARQERAARVGQVVPRKPRKPPLTSVARAAQSRDPSRPLHRGFVLRFEFLAPRF